MGGGNGSHRGACAVGTPRWLLVVVTVLSLLAVSACTVTPGNPNAVEGRVLQGGTTIEFRGIVVSLPDGVAPVGTKVSLRAESQTGTQDAAVAVSDGISIQLGDGLQPPTPLTIIFPVDRERIPSADGSAQRLIVRATSSDGEVRLHAGTYNPEAATYTVEVDHLYNFQVFGIDLGAVLDEVRAAIVQGIGLEYPAPDCVSKTTQINDVSYNVVSPAQSWLCLESQDGELLVKAYANSAIPFIVTSRPSAKLSTFASDVKLATSTLIVIAGHLGFIGTTQAAVMPGATAEVRFRPAPEAATLTFEQYPALLLMAILAATVDTMSEVLGVKFLLKDRLDGLQCLADAAEITGRGVALNGETVGGITRAFFDCVGPMMGEALGAKGAIIVAILGAAPGFLVSSLVGLLNEVTGGNKAEVPLDVRQPAKTVIVNLEPLLPGGEVRNGFKLDTSGASRIVDCSYDNGSPSGVSKGTHMCGGTAESCHAAVSSPKYPGSVLCLNSAFEPTLRLHRATNLNEAGIPTGPIPLGIQTSDGSRWWLRIGGAWGGRADGAIGAYGCESGPCNTRQTKSTNQVILSVEGKAIVNRASPIWTVFVGDIGDPNRNYPAPTRLNVTRAWFLSNPAA